MLRRWAFHRSSGLFLVVLVGSLPAAMSSTAGASGAVETPFVRNAPRIDGSIDVREWIGPTIPLSNGSMRLANDGHRLYVLLNMTADDGDDPGWGGQAGGDDVWISFDVDGDQEITPGVDVNFTLDDATTSLRMRRYAGPGAWVDLPSTLGSSWAPGFGCWFADGSRRFSTSSGETCARHRVHEFGFDLREILSNGSTVRMGVRVHSSAPEIQDVVPDNFWNSFSDLIEVHLAPSPTPLLPPYPGAEIRLAGHQLEITQATQTTNNQIRLVAGKETVARIFAWTHGTTQPQDAVLYLYAERDGEPLPGSPLAQMVRVNRTLPARDALNGTANLRLPTSWTEGSVTFRARARGLAGPNNYSSNLTRTFLHRTVPTFWTLPINTRNTGDPRLIDPKEMARQESYTEAVFPVRDIIFVRKPWNAVPPVNPYSPENALPVLNKYYDQTLITWYASRIRGRTPFTLPHQIYGFGTSGGGISDPTWWNAGRGVVGSGYIGIIRDGTHAHEVNHNLDRSSVGTWGRHVAACGASGPDGAWPYANGNINEIGFDTRTPWVHNNDEHTTLADSYPDFMGYCRSSTPPWTWISPYRYNALFDHFALSESSTGGGRAVNVLYVSGVIRSNGSASLDPIIVGPGGMHPTAPGEYTIDLLDAQGQTLGQRSMKIAFESVEGEPQPEVPFSIQLLDVPGVKRIEIRIGTQTLASRVVSSNAPTISVTSPSHGASYPSGYVYVSWNASDADGDALRYAIHYSPDEGESWYPVAFDLTETSYQLHTRLVPGGPKSRIRVIATDGYHTRSADSSGTFFLERQVGQAVISSPIADEVFGVDEDIWLRGAGFDAAGNPAGDDQLFWQVNGEFVAAGPEARITLPLGIHTIRLYAKDGPWYVSSQITVRVGGTCADRGDVRDESGPVSGPAHDVLEPLLGSRAGDAHAINCDLVVKNGL